MQIINLDEHCVIKWRITDVCNYHCSYCIRRDFIIDEKGLEDDEKLYMAAVPDVIRIAEELHQITNKLIKIDLIGGEITLFKNLDKLLENLYKSEYIVKINITTNLSASLDYYLNLYNIAKKYNKTLSMTASYHYEYSNLDEYLNKVDALNKELGANFKCETVITKDNANEIEKFIEGCNKIGCYYMCEEDLTDSSKTGKEIRNYKKNYRYLVKFDDGTEELFKTRNEVLKKFGINSYAVPTKDKKCTRDHDYVYLEKNTAIPCKMQVPIETYHVRIIPRVCQHESCTLCGHISIYDK